MSIRIELLRPDDLLCLQVEGINLRLDQTDPQQPALTIDNPAMSAWLVVNFPPQAIGEQAFFESGGPAADLPGASPAVVAAAAKDKLTPSDSTLPPGVVKARIAGRSRLVFRVDPGVRILYSIDGMLDWSKLPLSVGPIAAIGPSPTADQIAAAPAIMPPLPTHTAIELPYRLVISPSSQVQWAHRRTPFTVRGRTELWHTRMQHTVPAGGGGPESESPIPLRAIWSDDFNLAHPPSETEVDKQLGRSAMSPNDRHQLVILTSAFHSFENDLKVSSNRTLGGIGAAAGLRVGSIFGGIRAAVPFVPSPFYADELMLSSLGGWLHSRGNWDPPRRAKPARVLRVPSIAQIVRQSGVGGPFRQAVADRGLGRAAPGAGLPSVQRAYLEFSAAAFAGTDLFVPREPPVTEENLSLSEWVHIASQGRNHYVRIVYEGMLLPSRHPASLVKVTERKFKEHNGLVVAYLMQRMFIVVRKPGVAFAESRRGMPMDGWKVTTLVTPDIAEPAMEFGAGRSFWVEIQPDGAPRYKFAFHGIGTDRGNRSVGFTGPMMFVSSGVTGAQRKAAEAAYGRSRTLAELEERSLRVPGQQMHFAPPQPGQSGGNTSLVVQSLNFIMDPTGAGPVLLKAEVNIPQVRELLGTDATTSIRMLSQYVDGGFDGASGAFAEVVRTDFSGAASTDPLSKVVASTLGVEFQGRQGGGFATPNMAVSTLTRELGPLAGSAADAISGNFEPKSFFKAGMAKLFGTFELADVLKGAESLGQGAPKLRTETKGDMLVATLDWQPTVQEFDAGVAKFTPPAGAKLIVKGRIEKPILPPGAAAAPGDGVTSELTGTLKDFAIDILSVITVSFAEFAFIAQSGSKSGSKTDVRVQLDPANPLKFTGDLEFVEEIRKIVPPDLFGDGPTIDINEAGIRAGFALMLPPVAVGVFALKDISLGAFLMLPFADGKPTLEFNLSERQHPFLLAVSIFGGGGFFRLQLDTAGIKIVEAAFEFGATASIDIGVASGGVHIMAGIYFKLERRDPGTALSPTLGGYLRLGGELSVLGLVKISVEFVLSFTYIATGEAFGRATLTVKVEIAFFSKSVELTVERRFGGSNGDPKFGDMFNKPSVWSEYAGAFA